MERSKTGKSVSQFPELIRDALAFVADALEAKQKGTLGTLKYGYGIKPEVFESTIFSPSLAGFYFFILSRLFFQPQNILPISSSLFTISSYCLLEISFASHIMETKNLRTSNLEMQTDRLCDFSSFWLKYVVYESSKRSRNMFSTLVAIV